MIRLSSDSCNPANVAPIPHPGHCLSFLALALCFVGWVGVSSLWAGEPEYIQNEGPAPSSTNEIRSAITKGFEEKKAEPSRLESIKKKIEAWPPFFRDTTLNAKIRSYYFRRDFDDPSEKKEAWALGGWLDYMSGYMMDRLRIGASLYTSQKLYGPEDRDGTLLLGPGQKGFTVLGQAYLEGRILDNMFARLYRQTLDLPFINKDDSRMAPNTFEAYVLGARSLYNTDFIVGHITKMKPRNETGFSPMSEIAGVRDKDRGVSLAGARYTFSKAFDLGAISEYGWDLWNTIYAEGRGNWKLNDRLGLRVAGQVIDQRSVGDQLAGDFSTNAYGVQGAVSYKGLVFDAAFTTTSEGGVTQSPYGGHPGYLSSMIQDFNRAGENAWGVGLSYDFSFLLDGLSAFTRYARGYVPHSGKNAAADQWELDVTVDYRLERGALKGLWLRVRGGWLDQTGPLQRDRKDFRIILNYDFAVL
jgi:hypothetical protein